MSLFKNKKIVFSAIAVISVVGLICLALAHWPVRGSVDVRWPTKSHTHTLLLRPASSSESSRLVDYAPDNFTITGMRIEYRDGRTALVSYEQGQPTAISQYAVAPTNTASTNNADPAKPLVYPKSLSDGLSARQLESVIEVKSDGKTIKTLTTYRPDGNIAAMGVRDVADDFVVTFYGADSSAAVAGIAVFNGSDGSLKSEQDFRADGTVASSFTSQDSGSSQGKETFFDTAGNKAKEVVFNGSHDVVINEFAADGKTLKTKTSFGWSGVTVTTFDVTGTKAIAERSYVDDTHINVRYFDDNGTAYMQQHWGMLDTNTVSADRVGIVNDGYCLTEVEEYHSDGMSIKADVKFFPGGKVVREYETRATTDYRPRNDQHFRQDGSLDYTEDCPADEDTWSCNTTRMPDGPNNVRIKVPASYFKVSPLLPVPDVQRPTIPSMPLTVDLR